MNTSLEAIKEHIAKLIEVSGTKPYLAQVTAEAILNYLWEEGFLAEQEKS